MSKEVKNLNISFLLDFYGDLLTEKQKEAIDLYYNEDLSLAEIAEQCSISRQGVRDSIKRGETQLLEFESTLGLAEKFKNIKTKLDEIEKLSLDIQNFNGRMYSAGNIESCAKSINQLCKEISNGI